MLLEMGRATLEIFDEGHAAQVDQIEVGERVSGRIRFALQVPDVHAAAERLMAKGAVRVHEAVKIPWGDTNIRLRAPGGMWITMFQAPESGEPRMPPAGAMDSGRRRREARISMQLAARRASAATRRRPERCAFAGQR